MKILYSLIVVILTILSVYTNAQNVNVTYTKLNWNSMDAKYLTDNILLILDDNGYCWRSEDGGLTLKQITTNNVLQTHHSIVVDPTDSSNVLLHTDTTSGTTLLISSNYMKDYDTVSVNDIQFSSFTTHRWKSGLLLGKAGSSSYYSDDFGHTWNQIFVNSVVQQVVFDPHRQADPANGLFAIITVNEKPTLVYSSDLGKSYTILYNDITYLEVRRNYFIAYGVGLNLYTRSNYQPYNNNKMGFLKVAFDLNGAMPVEYTMLDDSTSAIWMGLRFNLNDKTGSIYISDSTGSQFTLSTSNVNVFNGVYDFTPQYGIPGIYFVNIVKNPNAGPGNPVNVQSQVSYNNGGSWKTIPLPAGSPYKSGSYNFNGPSTFYDPSRQYGPYYSNEYVPGMVLGTGNMLYTLSSKPDLANLQTRVSRDSGLTWTDIYEKPSIYEFGNYGTLVVYADATTVVNSLYYSLDQGKTSVEVMLGSPNPVDVINIITDPDASGQTFLAYTVDSVTKQRGIFTIDFTTLNRPACTNDDLEFYTTPDILGGNRTYSRVKQTSNCFQTVPLPGATVDESECEQDDYECDLGYTEVNQDGTPLRCGVSPSYVAPADPPEFCPAGTKYPVTKGYRKIADDICIGGVASQYDPDWKDCPNPNEKKSRGWVAAIVILVILAVVISVSVFYLYKHPETRENLMAKLGISKDKVKYSSLGFKPNSLADDEFGIEDDDDAQILDDNDF